MIEINIYWWVIPVMLALFPIIYTTYLRKSGGDYDFSIDVMLITIGCWVGALSLIIGWAIGRWL